MVVQGVTNEVSVLTCPSCKKVFQSKRRQQYCSKRCAWDAKRKPKLDGIPAFKKCSHCKMLKAAIEFNVCRSTHTGLQAWCKHCQSERPTPAPFEYECSVCQQWHRRLGHHK